tara:strand:- start:36582 stop:37361 length:780 start_codon:yes stop_codon:yes gene_type:complete
LELPAYIWLKKTKKGLKTIRNIIVFAVLMTSISVFAQRNRYTRTKISNLSTFDDKFMHFGFSLGINSSDFTIDYDLSRNDSLKRLEVDPQLGFNLGIVTDLHLGPHFNLRFIPTLSFSQRNVQYEFRSFRGEVDQKFSKPVESTYLDFPLNLKLRSARDNNFAAYVLGGFMYSYDLVSQEDSRNNSSNPDDIVIKLSKNTYHYQVGFGFDFFLQYFKFSPEFKLSMGLGDQLIQDNTLFANPIDRIRSRVFLVSLTFEG